MHFPMHLYAWASAPGQARHPSLADPASPRKPLLFALTVSLRSSQRLAATLIPVFFCPLSPSQNRYFAVPFPFRTTRSFRLCNVCVYVCVYVLESGFVCVCVCAGECSAVPAGHNLRSTFPSSALSIPSINTSTSGALARTNLNSINQARALKRQHSNRTSFPVAPARSCMVAV